jgi:hypothetical protein
MLGKIGKAIGGIAKKAVGALSNPLKMLKKLAGPLKGLLKGALGFGMMGAGMGLGLGFMKGFLGQGGMGAGLSQGCCNAAQQRGLSNVSFTNINIA